MQVFGILAMLSLISLRSTQAANFELSQRLLLAGERAPGRGTLSGEEQALLLAPPPALPCATLRCACCSAAPASTVPPCPRLCSPPCFATAEQNAATIMGTLRDAQDSLERVSGEAAAATKEAKQAKQDLHTVGVG